MRGVVVVMLEVLCWLLFFLNIAVFVYLGGELAPAYAVTIGIEPPNTIVAMVVGGVVGLLTSVVTFGMIFAVLDIRANSRRTAILLEDLKERRSAAAADRLRD